MLAAKMTIEERIVFILSNKESGGRLIREKLMADGASISSQAVYNALAKLIEQGVVIKHGITYSLNYVWLLRVNDFVKEASKTPMFTFQELEEGEKVIYKFHDLEKTSTFWMHIFQVLYNRIPSRSVIPIYSSHEWTNIVRPDQDAEWQDIVARGENLVLFAIGSSSHNDKHYSLEKARKNLIISFGKDYNFDTGYYLNVFGDYVVELSLPKTVSKAMDHLFSIHNDEKSLRIALMETGFLKKPARLVIKRKSNLAEKLYKRITKDFHIPKNFINPFETKLVK